MTRLIDSLLTALHRRTGRNTSPHLQSAVERISIDGRPISPALYVDTYREIEPFVEMVDAQSEAAGGPRMSKFEVVTAMAFAAFADAPVDVAVVEVGLGGRWDATNVINAPVAVITPIGIDHVDFLGDTIAEIASEKAGIITKQQDDLVPEGHRRGDRAADARGHGGVAGGGAPRRCGGGPRGLRVRGAATRGRGRGAGSRTSGSRRRLLGRLPAASR